MILEALFEKRHRLAAITNKGVVEDLTGVPLLDHLIHGQDFLDVDAYLSL